MKVRGIVLQTRKAVVTQRFGAEAWAGLYRDVSAAHPCLRAPVTRTSLITLPAFLAFHDELMRRFFRDDDESHFLLGGDAARWTMGEGPLRSFLDWRDVAELVTALPNLWTTFFLDTSSHMQATLGEDGVRCRAFDLPERHRYFESFIVGYIKGILEMFCANPIAATRIRGGNGRHYHYLLHVAPPAASPGGGASAHDHGERARRSIPSMSDREAEVLLLLAEGKSNREIGVALGISGKTAQHHITHAYKKIGASGRVAATMWLARRGLIGK